MTEISNNFLPPELARKTAMVTTTMFPRFDPDSIGPHDVDTVRGRLALQTLDLAKRQGISIVLMEDGSSPDFRQALQKLGVDYLEGGRGMGPGRRTAFARAFSLERIEYVLWTEPEKAPLVGYSLPSFIAPLLSGEAELVVANRELAALDTYPAYQLETEIKANRLMNESLRRHQVWPKENPEIDFIFAPRFYKKNDRNFRYLTERFDNVNTVRIKGTHKLINLDKWPASIVIPVVRALYDSSRSGQNLVAAVQVPYRHPKEQTESEIDSPELSRKRWEQYTHFIYSLERVLMYLEGNPRSGLVLVK